MSTTTNRKRDRQTERETGRRTDRQTETVGDVLWLRLQTGSAHTGSKNLSERRHVTDGWTECVSPLCVLTHIQLSPILSSNTHAPFISVGGILTCAGETVSFIKWPTHTGVVFTADSFWRAGRRTLRDSSWRTDTHTHTHTHGQIKHTHTHTHTHMVR